MPPYYVKASNCCLAYTEPSIMWIDEAGSELSAIVIEFRVAYPVFSWKMYFSAHPKKYMYY